MLSCQILANYDVLLYQRCPTWKDSPLLHALHLLEIPTSFSRRLSDQLAPIPPPIEPAWPFEFLLRTVSPPLIPLDSSDTNNGSRCPLNSGLSSNHSHAIMGIFSRREKAHKPDPPLNSSYSTTSVQSSGSKGIVNRISASSVGPGTPLSPRTPVRMPKVDMPRPPDPQLDPAGYLRSLPAIRERSRIVFEKAVQNDLKHFDVEIDKLQDVVTFVTGLIKVCSASCLRIKLQCVDE